MSVPREPTTKREGVEDTLLLRGREIPVVLCSMPHVDLRFYLDNPRLYSIVRAGGKEPAQEEIEQALLEMDHVRQLINSIAANGGLIDPLIVQDGQNIVLEGNSRLAAYRKLARTDPVKWGKVRVKLLPPGLDHADIFALLGEYHIIGKKDWSPFEQAGYLFRRYRTFGVPVETLASELGMSGREVGQLVETYNFMQANGVTDSERWSYYFEFLRSNTIRRARSKHPQLDAVVQKHIESGDIPRAADVRDKLKKICAAGGKVLDRYANGKAGFDTSYDSAIEGGAGTATYQRLKRFRTWLAEPGVLEELLDMDGEVGKRATFELRQIDRRLRAIFRKLQS